ncbi:MAG TPA: hypothetical protein VMA72_04095 [Streptosporangiaceae bacterium]|nr:hypothetical protein [Streptosporangiaceae bacterium]
MTSPALASRGRVTGTMLMLLGAWAALVPFIGPYFGYAYTPDKAWAYTSGRLWLSVLPGTAAFLGGLLVLASDGAATFGAFLGVLGGTWLVIGPPVTAFALAGRHISTGSPVASHGAIFGPTTMRFLENLGFFYGLGIVVVFLAAVALGEVVVARLAADRFSSRLAEEVASQTQSYPAQHPTDQYPTDQYGPAY